MVRLRRLFVLPLLLASLAGWTAYAVHTLVPDAGAVNAFFETRLYYGLLFAAVALCGLRALSVAEDRAAWALIGAGVGSFALADVYWQVVLSSAEEQPFLRSPTPATSPTSRLSTPA